MWCPTMDLILMLLFYWLLICQTITTWHQNKLILILCHHDKILLGFINYICTYEKDIIKISYCKCEFFVVEFINKKCIKQRMCDETFCVVTINVHMAIQQHFHVINMYRFNVGSYLLLIMHWNIGHMKTEKFYDKYFWVFLGFAIWDTSLIMGREYIFIIGIKFSLSWWIFRQCKFNRNACN